MCAQAPLGSVKTDGNEVSGLVTVSGGRAVIGNKGAVLAGQAGAEVQLHRGGTVKVCVAPGMRKGLRPVGSFPSGESPCGALDMAGNAWEWVSDAYGGDPQRRIIRGGAVGYGERAARTYHRAIEGAGVT